VQLSAEMEAPVDDTDDGNGARRANERERCERERTRKTVTDAMCDAIDNGSPEEDEDAWKDLGLGGAR